LIAEISFEGFIVLSSEKEEAKEREVERKKVLDL
jgi:hypothetical protein